ncbi:hypothetical protein ES703_81720 [subsurface metagenome]
MQKGNGYQKAKAAGVLTRWKFSSAEDAGAQGEGDRVSRERSGGERPAPKTEEVGKVLTTQGAAPPGPRQQDGGEPRWR